MSLSNGLHIALAVGQAYGIRAWVAAIAKGGVRGPDASCLGALALAAPPPLLSLPWLPSPCPPMLFCNVHPTKSFSGAPSLLGASPQRKLLRRCDVSCLQHDCATTGWGHCVCQKVAARAGQEGPISVGATYQQQLSLIRRILWVTRALLCARVFSNLIAILLQVDIYIHRAQIRKLRLGESEDLQVKHLSASRASLKPRVQGSLSFITVQSSSRPWFPSDTAMHAPWLPSSFVRLGQNAGSNESST